MLFKVLISTSLSSWEQYSQRNELMAHVIVLLLFGGAWERMEASSINIKIS